MKRILILISILSLFCTMAFAYSGLAVGNKGANAIIYILRGDTLIATSALGVTSKLKACKIVDANTMYACGSGGVILKSIDAGTNWTSLTTGVTDTLYSLSVSPNNNSILFCCGSGGRIIKSTNGGTSWSSLTSGSTNSLRSIKAVTDSIVYAVGSDTTILKSINGSSWTRQTVPSNTVGMLNSIDIYGGIGYISGNGGIILKNNNYGAWQRQISGVSGDIMSLNMISATSIYAIYTDTSDGVPRYLYNTNGAWTNRYITFSGSPKMDLSSTAQKTVDQFNAYALINYNYVVYTNNSGYSWKKDVGITDSLWALDILVENPFNNRYIATLFNKQDIDSTYTYYTPPFLLNNFGWFGVYVYSYGTTPRYTIKLQGAPTLNYPFVCPSDSIVADSCGMAGFVNQWIQLRLPPGQYGRLAITGLSGNGANTTTSILLYSWGQ